MCVHACVQRPSVGLTWPPVQWETEFVSRVKSGQGVKLTAVLHLAPRL
jgi:hypothetical protein